jgi:Protein of unknown function (DUF2510)
MTTNAAPPGWHPDPSNPRGALRWWDGIAWTHHTQQPAAVPTAPDGACAAPAAWPGAGSVTAAGSATAGGYPGAGYPTGGHPQGSYPTGGYPAGGYGQAHQASFAKQNSLSLTAIGVVAFYILIAMSSHIVFLGIFPVMLSVRAVNRKESLAPVAVIAAIVAIGVAFLALK